MIVYIAPVSGLSDRLRQQNESQQRKSREEVLALNPACYDCCYAKRFKSTWRGKFMKNHTRVFDYKSSAGKAAGDISLRAFK
ncbi:TPA: hypothetical protein ACX3KG_003612 [Raoultella ornithinolytica]|nr:hypothetical protein [Klebsiella pneumoniae]